MAHCLANHQITGHIVFFLVSTEWVMMCPAIDNPASCEVCTVISYRELCTVYGQNVMSEGTIRQWRRLFKDGQTNVHDEEWSVWLSVVSDDLVQSVDQKICERQCFTISERSYVFPQILPILLYKIITVRLGFHIFCARWVLRMLMGACREWLRLWLRIFRVMPQRWWWIFQLHRNRRWNLGFIRKCWN
jgi:hypothetical protein